MIAQLFATIQLVRLIQIERGPFAIFERMRALPTKLTDKFGLAEEVRQAMACKYCLSGYLALIAMLLPKPVLQWLAVWGGVVMLYDSVNYVNHFPALLNLFVSQINHAMQFAMRPNINQAWPAPKVAASPTPTPTKTSGR